MILFLSGVAYIIGSISTAILWSRFQGLPDPRLYGSGNPGTNNVLRISGKKAAIMVLLGDALKGALPVWGASMMGVSASTALAWIALAAVVGHVYPLFFGFKGGKGVATAGGGLLALSWPLGLLLGVTWLIAVIPTRYSSLGAIVTAILAPIYAIVMVDAFFPVLLIGILIIWRHRENIARLLQGGESKIKW